MMTPSTPLWLRIRARVSSTSDALLVAAAAAMVARGLDFDCFLLLVSVVTCHQPQNFL